VSVSTALRGFNTSADSRHWRYPLAARRTSGSHRDFDRELANMVVCGLQRSIFNYARAHQWNGGSSPAEVF